jgi:hypothetical protein
MTSGSHGRGGAKLALAGSFADLPNLQGFAHVRPDDLLGPPFDPGELLVRLDDETPPL